MRVHLITAQKVKPEYINYGMYETLCRGLSDHGKATIVDTNPDIVHIFGLWNRHYANVAAKYAKRGIPVVFTSLDGLPQLMRMYRKPMSTCRIRRITRVAAVTQVCGATEEGIVRRIDSKAQCEIIRNPSYTTLTSAEELLTSIEHLYVKVVDEHDKKIRSGISNRVAALHGCDDAMKEICSQMLYLKYLLHRGSIPKGFITNLASTLTATDYDEDKMAATMKRLGTYKMSARAMQVMGDLGILTEGFMPMPPIADGRTTTMKQCIV